MTRWTASTERVVFFAAACAMWAFYVLQAWHTPTLLDDWYQLAWHRQRELSFASVWDYGYYNYFNFNPRIGDILMMLVNGPGWIHLVFTPLVQMAVLPLAFALVFARWPRATFADLQLLLVLQTFIWLVIPFPGIVYYYRPFTTNYIWAFAIMMALFVPYRFALARETTPKHRFYLIPFMLAFGWVAGMGNEHTGPSAMVAMAIILYVAWRKRRLRAWMIAGAVGLYVGYPMLFFAPGQALRYAGIAQRYTPSFLLKTRGIDGMFDIVLDFIAEAQFAINLVLVSLLIAWRRARAAGKQLPSFGKHELLAMLGLIFAAAGMVATQFASPTVGERLFFAPAVLFIGALLVVVHWTFGIDRVARRMLLITCTVLFLYQAFRMAYVLAATYPQVQARMELLRSAPKDSIVKIPPFETWKRSRYWWGDDFIYASLREYVANEVYDLKNIHYDRHLHFVEPPPPYRFTVKREFSPPLTPEQDAKLEARYVPTFWEWAITQLRRSREQGGIKALEGKHELVRYTVDLVDTGFFDPKRRPIRVFDWTPQKMTYVDGRMYDDPNGQPYVRVWDRTMPPNVTDIYVEYCGKTERVTPVPDIWEEVGPLVPIKIACRGSFTVFLCQPDLCWFAGRYWR